MFCSLWIWTRSSLLMLVSPACCSSSVLIGIDQIVRTDMQELVDLDLQDHVYGYPPMGNDRLEMEGFRFWKTGYWKEALRGRPYHISALYVIDLKRFRQLATGVRPSILPICRLLINRIDFVVNIKACPPIPTPSPTSTRIYRIQCKTKSRFSP